MRRQYVATKGRACTGKPAFDEQKARREVARLIRTGTSPDRIRAYPCKHCPSWHVGHTHRSRR